MADPTILGRFGHRFGVYMQNVTSGSEIWVDRVQRYEPSFQFRTQDYFELGRVGKVGVTQDPAEYRIVLEENLHNSELDFLLAGKEPLPAGALSYDLGDLIGKNISAYLVGRNDSDVVDLEIENTQCRIAEVQFRFTVRDAIMSTWTYQGIAGQWYTQNFAHAAWGGLDNVSPGGIHGKDARIWMTAGAAAADRSFRLQAFTIRATFPVEPVSELGRRALVGQVSDSPNVIFDFDVLVADHQPIDKLFTANANGYDLSQPSALFTTRIRVYDPEAAEAATLLKQFKLENCRVVSGSPTRAQVRGLATMRYSCTVAKETTVDSGGLIVSNQDDI